MSNCMYIRQITSVLMELAHILSTSTDSVDPAGLNNPKYPWNIVNGAAGHYDGLDPLNETLPYWADVGIST
jgi:hypothetical protein